MTRAAKQKLSRESTAAYAASQPLFDALRIGASKIGEQRFHLNQARDIVHHLHVQILNPDNKDEVQKHERYIDCAVQAWRSATEVYSEIFQNLAKVTAADPTVGRPQSQGHDTLKVIAETAAAAKKAVFDYKLSVESARSGSNHAQQPATSTRPAKRAKIEAAEEEKDVVSDEDSLADSEEGEEKVPVDNTPTNPHLLALLGKRPAPTDDRTATDNSEPPKKVPRLSDKIQYDAQGRKIFWDRGAEKPNVPYSTLGSSEKKAWKAEKARQKREKKAAKRAQENAGAGGRPPGPDRRLRGLEDDGRLGSERDFIPLNSYTAPAAAGKENDVPGVEYEDVSAEVEARLRTKEEKKKAKKEEKKRKRDSDDSALVAAPEEPTEKPKRKKPKSGADAGAPIEKRKTAELGEEVADSHKRRKKSNS